MKRLLLLLSLLLAAAHDAAAQEPLYLVNGREVEEIGSIPPDDIESVEMLPADEETIARYGEKAFNGVMVVTLRYDSPARFTAAESFDAYIASQVKWSDDETAARVVLRYTVNTDGRAEVSAELESTDSRLRRRVLKAVEEAPLWSPPPRTARRWPAKGCCASSCPKANRSPACPS